MRMIASILCGQRIRSLFFLSLLMAATFVARIYGQSGECGTELMPGELAEALKRAQVIDAAKASRSTDHYSIPIVMHIVRASNGTGGITPADIQAAVDSANIFFAQVNVSIYLYNPVNFIDEDYFYLDMSTGAKMDSIKRYDRVPEAINIYWVPNTSGFPYCGISSFTTSAVQGIIMNNSCGGTFDPNSTLVHEIGHYFDLYHTHETAFGTECPDGSNCSSAGDLICDTPADPTLTNHVSAAPACAYDNAVSPPGGCDATPYNPYTDNIMSYSRQSCRDALTPMQITKYRTVLETLRPELAMQVNGLEVFPLAINPLVVPLTQYRDTAVHLENHLAQSMMIQSAVSMLGEVSVLSGVPANLAPNGSTNMFLRYDAGMLSSSCDLGIVSDTIVVTVSSPQAFTFKVPVTVAIAYEVPTQLRSQFGPPCLRFTVPNTPGIGDASGLGLVNSFGNYLYDGTLLLGLVNGGDTVVYQDAFSQKDFLTADNYEQGTDQYGRTTQTLRFTTTDARLSGEVIYHFGWNTIPADSCTGFEVEYRIRNDCDTTLLLAAGMFGDFDIGDSGNNSTIMSPALDAIYVGPNPNIAAFANLTPCQPDRGLHPISNPLSIYGNGSLRDGEAYSLMVGPDGTNFTGTDVSILLSFGTVTLAPGSERIFRAAIAATTLGLPPVNTFITNMRNLTGSNNCTFEVPSDYATIQAAINAASDFDVVLVAPGTYTGPSNVDLDFLGKKVSIRGDQGSAVTIIDCGGSPGTPHRAMKFDNPAEDSMIVIEGLTIKNGYAPSDAPFGQPHGGAILAMSAAGPTIRNCRFETNTCGGSGGAISTADSSSLMKISGCDFVQNSAPSVFGGAVKIGPNSAAVIENCVFSANSADGAGALSIDNNAAVAVNSCRFSSNQAQYAAALIIDNASPTFTGCQFDRNHANLAAGIGYVFNVPANPSFVNCTFFGNSVNIPPVPAAAGMLYADQTTIGLQNCIFAYNTGDEPLICPNGGSYVISCTDIFGNSPGDWLGCVASQNGVSGNISLNPQFCDTANTDLRVSSQSPCSPANNSCSVLMGSGVGSCGNTPAGSSIEVAVSSDVLVTFTSVSQDGQTTLLKTHTGPAAPAGFDIVPSNPKLYYDLSTTAPFTGTFDVCITYNPSDLGGSPESELRMFHRDGSQWVDITETLDQGNNKLCGKTDHFSVFILVVPQYQCGDADGSNVVNISDVVFLINYIFSGGPAPSPLAAADADCTGIVTISDAVYLIGYIFSGGAAPCAACP